MARTSKHRFAAYSTSWHEYYIIHYNKYIQGDLEHTNPAIRQGRHSQAKIDVMALDLIAPPTMRDLLTDEYFRGMMRRRPRLPENLIRPGLLTPPWAVWIEMTDGKWRRGKFDDYADAYRKMKEYLNREDCLDVAIVSQRFMMPPPIGFKWQWRKYPWCARCRRPSTFFQRWTHRAVNSPELLDSQPERCHFCGICKSALPRHSPR